MKIDFDNSVGQFKFIYFALIPLIVVTIVLFKKNKNSFLKNKELIISIFFLASILVFIYCQLLTKNQILIFSLIPISLAFSHTYTQKFFNKKYFTYFILFIFVISISKYHLRFNHNKKFMELNNANFEKTISPVNLDERLSGLKWITPDYISEPTKEMDLLVEVKKNLINVKENKIIVTDYQFFSSLLFNEIASPNKWYDELSTPNKNNKYYTNYKNFFLEKLKINKVKYIYFIGKNMHNTDFFDDFSYLNSCIISKNINELLIEFNISKCKEIL